MLEVAVVAAVTAIISFPVSHVSRCNPLSDNPQLVFLRVQSSVLVTDLFLECDPATNFYGLCEYVSIHASALRCSIIHSPNSTFRNVVLLLITAGIKLLLTAWTFGIQVPAGIFLPSITIGAALGRAVGLIMYDAFCVPFIP